MVQIEGDTASTLSDKNGQFTVMAGENDFMLISLYGYANYRNAVLNSNRVIKLEQTVEINTDVDIGYRKIEKISNPFAVATLTNANVFTETPAADYLGALQGRMAGLSVTHPDGQPGQLPQVTVRNQNSLQYAALPLYVVDGIPVEAMGIQSLHPLDITNITLLKDASAAIYGSRGANGVILIETKKGSIGKLKIGLETYAGIRNAVKKIRLLNKEQYINYQLERGRTTMENFFFPQPNISLASYQNLKYYNWQEELFRSGFMHSQYLNLSGGDTKTQYNISTSALGQQGTIDKTSYQRFHVKAGLQQLINASSKLNINVNLSADDQAGQISALPQTAIPDYSAYTMYSVWGYRPISSFSENGSVKDQLTDPQANQLSINPLVAANNNFRHHKQKNVMANLSYTKQFRSGFEWATNANVIRNEYRLSIFNNSKTIGGKTSSLNTNGANGAYHYAQLTAQLLESKLKYRTKITEQNTLQAVAGFAWSGHHTRSMGYASNNILNEELGISAIDDGLSYLAASQLTTQQVLSGFAMADYQYQLTYSLSFGARYDGFNSGKYGNYRNAYPFVGLGWILSNEHFLKNANAIKYLKLRLSYGVTGNNRLFNYTRFNEMGLPYNVTYDSSMSGSANSSLSTTLSEQRTKSFNVGYDLELLKDSRINITADYFSNSSKTSNWPLNQTLSTAIAGSGFELSLLSKNIVRTKFSWATQLNFSIVRNNIKDLGNVGQILTAANWSTAYKDTPLYVNGINRSTNLFYGYQWMGVYALSDFDLLPGGGYMLKAAVSDNGTARNLIQPGDIKYQDTNGDKMINDLDRVVIGNPNPKHTGGISNRFTYRNFTFDVFCTWSYGNEILNANRLIFEGNAGNDAMLNQYASYADRWSMNNQLATNFRVGGQGPSGVYSSRVIEDGSYIKIKNVYLSYELPATLSKKIKLLGIQVFASASNVYTFTKYRGTDPEVANYQSLYFQGLDYGAYPQQRTMVLGLRATL
ncbi:TonB-dependent receptor [Pedobacter sp.]